MTINEDTWKKALSAHPEFSPHYEAARGKFLAESVARIARNKNIKHLCWLLERRHSDLFARPESVAVHVENNVSVAIPADVIERARLLSKEKPDGP